MSSCLTCVLFLTHAFSLPKSHLVNLSSYPFGLTTIILLTLFASSCLSMSSQHFSHTDLLSVLIGHSPSHHTSFIHAVLSSSNVCSLLFVGVTLTHPSDRRSNVSSLEIPSLTPQARPRLSSLSTLYCL